MKRLLTIITALFILSSCDNFGDINISPAKLTSASTRSLFTNSMQSLNNLVLGNTAASRLGSRYVQHLSEGPYPGSSLYSDRNLAFSTWFAGPLYDLETIINYNNEGNAATNGNGSKSNQIAVARILKAYYFLLMTDKWGDIPYSAALKGSEDYTPAYDKQQDIYNGIFKELTEAVAQIKEDESGVVGDILLGGNMGAWKRFANTQTMIMALRLSKADPAKGKSEFAAALAAGVMSSNSQNINYTFVAGDPNNYNPWYNNYSVSNRNDYAISTTLTDYMAPKNDPRLSVYAETLGGNAIKGLPYGRNTAVNIPAAYSRIGNAFRSQGSKLPIFNFAQVSFCLAEAAKIGYISGGDAEAEKYYYQGIKASWEQNGVFDQTQFDAYIADADVKFSASDAVKQIITEKWVHAYLNSWEAWNDYRRTGFPALTPAQDAVDSRGIPMRLGYPANESALNGENYNAAVTALGGKDDNYAKMWWAK